jgi:uncharacterized protein YwgA
VSKTKEGSKMEVDAKAILCMLAKRFELKRDSFGERLRLQKVVYLLQAFGVKLGYGFGWYRYGPYSQNLVSDAYSVLGSRRSEYERAAEEGEWQFSPDTEAKFSEFETICGDYLDSVEAVELLASVRFVRNVWYPDVNKEDFPEEFKKHKKRLCKKTPVDDLSIKAAFDVCERLAS